MNNVHFVAQFFSHFQDLEQKYHLPRVLHDFGVSLCQHALKPALIQSFRRLRPRAAVFTLNYAE